MNKLFKILTLSSVVFGLTSCLKDDGYDNGTTGHDLSNVPKIIELGFANEQAHNKANAFDFADAEVTATAAYVRLAAAAPASEDITVTLDTTGATAALEAIDPDIVIMPASFYTLDQADMTYTIAKGTSQVPIRITTNAIQFDPSTTYGLYFRIASVDKSGYNISGNYGYYIATFGAKNKYDGKYIMRGKHNRSPYTFPYEEEMDMVTVGSASVRFYFVAAGDFGHPIGTATGSSWYGATMSPVLHFDPSTNLITNVNNAGGSTQIFPYSNPPSIVGRYDAATKTIYAYWYYVTGAGQDFTNRGWSDTLIYQGPR